jgi:hypothetical protein
MTILAPSCNSPASSPARSAVSATKKASRFGKPTIYTSLRDPCRTAKITSSTPNGRLHISLMLCSNRTRRAFTTSITADNEQLWIRIACRHRCSTRQSRPVSVAGLPVPSPPPPASAPAGLPLPLHTRHIAAPIPCSTHDWHPYFTFPPCRLLRRCYRALRVRLGPVVPLFAILQGRGVRRFPRSPRTLSCHADVPSSRDARS